VVQRRGAYGHAHLARPRLDVGEVGQLDALGTTMAPDDHRLHAFTSGALEPGRLRRQASLAIG
jgi:hypothetical protein